MNELLRDLINIGKVAVFIDNIIVGMEGKEEHNELVAEIIKRLEENNLYVKPEKCKWKIREVGFLGVIIGLEGIKMEEEKDERCIRLANTKVRQGCTKVLRVGELLPSIHSGACVMIHMRTNIFLFLLFIFLDFMFLFL